MPANSDAKPVLPADPDHSHDAVMQQLDIRGIGPARRPTNQGFVASYEEKGRGIAAPAFEGLLGPIANWWFRRQAGQRVVENRGLLVMACQAPERAPVLATLAQEFGVCSKWFASVPGETWPNRNYLHAATSDGTTNIVLRFYSDPTIFELLEERGKQWHVYHDDTPQIWAFKKLWEGTGGATGSCSASSPSTSGKAGSPTTRSSSPTTAHPSTCHLSGGEPGSSSNSQHPGNNRVSNADYDGYPQAGHGNEDYFRAEQLVAAVYEALRSKPEVFERSLLLITYDEHGGLYDHVPPPTDAKPPGDPPNPGLFGRLQDVFLRRKAASFDFTVLGARVPAVVVSPWIDAGTVSAEVRDHSSVPATLRALFAPDAGPLTNRDRHANPFHTLLGRAGPRAADDVPDLSGHLPPTPPATRAAIMAPPEAAGLPEAEPPVPEYFQDFLDLADMVAEELATEPGRPRAAAEAPAEGPRARARQVTAAFAEAADQARRRG